MHKIMTVCSHVYVSNEVRVISARRTAGLSSDLGPYGAYGFAGK